MRKKMRKKKVLSIVFAVLSAMLITGNALQAAVLTVTTTEDNVEGSLRAAITIANTNSEADTIHLPAGTYLLTGDAGEDANISGDLDIDTAHKIAIIGGGYDTTIIDGNEKDRVFHILKGNVSISGVTVQNGRTIDGEIGGVKPGNGGGIYNMSTLTLSNCRIIKNRTGNGSEYDVVSDGGDGGGVYNTGTMKLTGCNVIDNRAGTGGDNNGIYNDSGDGGDGGGIYNSGGMTLKNCNIKKNQSGQGGSTGRYSIYDILGDGGRGGGIYNCGHQTVIGCRISHNTTGNSGSYSNDGDCGGNGGDGGGIFNSGTQTIKKCQIIHNQTGYAHYTDCGVGICGRGGGICNDNGNTFISKSFIAHNRTGSPSWESSGGDGGGIFNNSTLTINHSTVAFNAASTGYNYNDEVRYGGGICNVEGANAAITNSTISNNQIYSYDIAIAPNGKGGGVFNSGTLDLTNCTVCRNSIGEPDDFSWVGYGGGIYNTSNGTVKTRNTIVADNQTPAPENGPDCWGELDSRGYNLIEDTNNCIITGDLIGNITGVDPLLGPLADNGGPTRTHALLPGSPAVDAGNRSDLSTDQRGYPRPVDIPGIANVSDGSDIGAFEAEVTPIPPEFYTISGKVTDNGTGFAGVTLTFSNNGDTAGTTITDEQGNYSHAVPGGWSGMVTPAMPGYTFTPANRSYNNISVHHPNQNYTGKLIIPPGILLNRSQINFGAANPGYSGAHETLLISNSGGGILNWSVSCDVTWLICSPSSGSNRGEVTVTMDASGLSPGTYATAIKVEDANAVNSPQFVKVTLAVYDAGTTYPPFGCFDTPVDGSFVSGSIPVTGWALDNIGIKNVKIYRTEPGKNKETVYIGDALFVEGARPDVLERYPDYPGNYRAGWGYMMLTNFLPNSGNGTFKIHAIAADIEGNQVTLGIKTIICDNANAVKPFGAIDTPTPGGAASGSHFVNFGWALTPLPNTIPEDGSTITVWVDGVPLGSPVYNRYREDIAALFPGYNNSDGAGGHYYLDTTQFTNGLHTIQWTVTDDAGNTDGIGSRYFNIQNPGGTAASSSKKDSTASKIQRPLFNIDVDGIPVDDACPILVKKGYNREMEPRILYPDESGDITIETRELERLQIYLSYNRGPAARILDGFQVIGNRYAPLPIGSNLDRETGVFTWQPGVGFLGGYCLVFFERDMFGHLNKKRTTIKITPGN